MSDSAVNKLKIQSVYSETTLAEVCNLEKNAKTESSLNDTGETGDSESRVADQGLPFVSNDLSHVNRNDLHIKSEPDPIPSEVIIHETDSITVKAEIEESKTKPFPLCFVSNVQISKAGNKETDAYSEITDYINCKSEEDRYSSQERNECSESFRSIDRLRQHFQEHDFRKKTFQCGMCGREMVNQAALNTHMLSHNSLQSTTVQNSSLTQHECPGCDRTFGQLDHLELHLLSILAKRNLSNVPYAIKVYYLFLNSLKI